MRPRAPAYFDLLLEGFRRGRVGRFVHLGHWDELPPLGAPPLPGEFECAQERLNQVLLDMADLGDGQRVLDVGCGFGGSLEKINESFQGVCLVGVNVDARQLAVCRQLEPLNNNRLAWVEADACRLPFRDGSFDCVLCIEAVFHFASRRAFFFEAARVLRPGGVLVLSDLFVTASAARLEVSEAQVEAVLRDGYGPWPGVWEENAADRELGTAAGLACTQSLDATSNTCPSHRFTVPDHLDERRDPGDAGARAALLLRRLHRGGCLRCVYLRFDKATTEDRGQAAPGATS